MAIYLTANWELSGVPVTGLSPTVTVYQASDDVKVIDAESMSEIADGFYKYDASDVLSAGVDYVIHFDAGTDSVDDRLQTASTADGSFDTPLEISATTAQKLRYMLIQRDDSTALPDNLLAVYLEDAALVQSSSDDYALRAYTCYMIANNWQALGQVKSSDGVTYKHPDPEKFLALYNARLDDVVATADGAVGFVKTSTDLRYDYDETTNEFERSGYQ